MFESSPEVVVPHKVSFFQFVPHFATTLAESSAVPLLLLHCSQYLVRFSTFLANFCSSHCGSFALISRSLSNPALISTTSTRGIIFVSSGENKGETRGGEKQRVNAEEVRRREQKRLKKSSSFPLYKLRV